MPTCGEFLVKLLEAYGVEIIFGIPGVHTVELYRGLPGTRIRHVTPRHEQGAGFMADGYARATGKPGVCFIITGPGMTNIATAMGQAYANSVPMLVISSVNARIASRHGARPAARAALAAQSDRRRFRLQPHAARSRAIAGSSGPRLRRLCERAAASGPYRDPARCHHREDGRQGQDLAAALAPGRRCDAHRAKPPPARQRQSRPLIIAGGGAADAAAGIRALAETLDAPVFTTINGKGILPTGHKLALAGNLGMERGAG